MPSFAATFYADIKGSDPFFDELTADWFDEYLNYRSSDDVEPGKCTFPEAKGVDSPEGADDYHGTYSGSKQGEAQDLSTQSSWESGFWSNCGSSSFNPVTPGGNDFYNHSSSQEQLSDVDLLNFAKLSIDLPQPRHGHDFSPPPSPSPNPMTLSRRKNRFVDTISKTLRKATSGLDSRMRSTIGKTTVSPSRTRTLNTSEYNFQVQQLLTLDTSQFDFGFETTAPLTPPPSIKIPNALQKQNSVQDFVAYATGKYEKPAYYTTSMGTPKLEPQAFRNAGSLRTPSNGSLHPQTPQFRHTSAAFSPFVASQALDAFSTPGSYEDIDSTSGWNTTSTAPLVQPSPISFHLNTRQATNTVANQLHNNLAFDMNDLDFSMDDMGYNIPSMPTGLMVHMPNMPTKQSSGVDTSTLSLPQDFYPPLPPEQQSEPHSSPSPSTRGRQTQKYAMAPRGRHSSVSAPKTRSRFSGCELSSSDSSSTFNVRKQRKSSSRSRKAFSAPRTITFGTVGDFVNYTPKDGRTILRGVAPSGSSKTKARREAEAAEKRRLLSRAAVRVVLAAGGDVGRLVEEGVLDGVE